MANREERRAAAKKGKTDGDGIIEIELDGKKWRLDIEEAVKYITALDVAQIRGATGMSLRAIFKAADDDPDLDVVATMIFLARRQTEPRVKFREVFDAVNYGSDLGDDDDADDSAGITDEDSSGAELPEV